MEGSLWSENTHVLLLGKLIPKYHLVLILGLPLSKMEEITSFPPKLSNWFKIWNCVSSFFIGSGNDKTFIINMHVGCAGDGCLGEWTACSGLASVLWMLLGVIKHPGATELKDVSPVLGAKHRWCCQLIEVWNSDRSQFSNSPSHRGSAQRAMIGSNDGWIWLNYVLCIYENVITKLI